MKRKRRIELTVETEQRLVVRWSRGAMRARCEECGGEMASLGGAAIPPILPSAPCAAGRLREFISRRRRQGRRSSASTLY